MPILENGQTHSNNSANIWPIWKHTRCGAILEILGSSRFYFSALRGGLLFGCVWGGGGGGLHFLGDAAMVWLVSNFSYI